MNVEEKEALAALMHTKNTFKKFTFSSSAILMSKNGCHSPRLQVMGPKAVRIARCTSLY